jgi:hypothetical protein
MTELSPTARALLDAARDGLGPDAETIRRMRHGIDAGVAAGAAGTALAVKLAVVAVVAAIVAGGLVYRGRDRDQLASPRLELPALTTERAMPAPHETAPAAPPEPSHVEMAPMPARTSTPAPAAPASPAAAAPRRATLAREVELVDQAMAALYRGDAQGALAAMRVHAAETAGTGQLAEDAAAIDIEARCRLHDPTTAARLDAFDRRWPRSAQRSRLTTSCP